MHVRPAFGLEPNAGRQRTALLIDYVQLSATSFTDSTMTAGGRTTF
jgi:hypothetical protein